VSIEGSNEGDVDEFKHLMAQSFEQAEFLYLIAKQRGVPDSVVLVATSNGRASMDESDGFAYDDAHLNLLEGAVIRRRIAGSGVEPITVTVFPRVALTHIFDAVGHGNLAYTIDRPASDGNMTLLLLKDDDYQCFERHAPHGI
jgi:hypothetical protein